MLLYPEKGIQYDTIKLISNLDVIRVQKDYLRQYQVTNLPW